MRPVVIVVFAVAVIALCAQIISHSYLRWIQSRSSVMEKYNPPPQNKIKNAKSLAELDAEYAKIKDAVKKADEDINATGRKVNRYQDEPFKTEVELKTAISNWERRAEEIRKVRFFWCCGVVLSVIGIGIFLKCPWTGFAFVAAGILQMIWWSSPSFSYNEASSEYNRMLENKFYLSIATFVFVMLVWFLFNKYRNRAKCCVKHDVQQNG